METKVAKQIKWWSAVIGTFLLLILLYVWEMRGVLTAILLLACIVTIASILMQSSKGGGLAALGGMGEQSPFGSRAAGPLRYLTYFFAAVFLVCTILLGRLSIARHPSTPRRVPVRQIPLTPKKAPPPAKSRAPKGKNPAAP